MNILMTGRPEIIIHTTHTCPFCKMEKAYLSSKEVPYTEHFVDDDEAAREHMVEMTGQRGVPVTLLEYPDGQKTCFIGYQEDLLERAIKGEKVGDPCPAE
jgi:glutaredoxin